jgi:hypothetical protein
VLRQRGVSDRSNMATLPCMAKVGEESWSGRGGGVCKNKHESLVTPLTLKMAIYRLNDHLSFKPNTIV